MSLDVYLEIDAPLIVDQNKTAILIREDGQVKRISRAEWDRRYPGYEPVTIELPEDGKEVYWGNVTHNLGGMAKEAGIFEMLWKAPENGIERAQQLIEPLSIGLQKLRHTPDRFKALNPPNGWGTYEGFVRFVDDYLTACRAYPSAKVKVCR